jgi:hypothetical protein
MFDRDVTQRIVYYFLGVLFNSPTVSMERTRIALNAGIVGGQLIRIPQPVFNTVVRLNVSFVSPISLSYARNIDG